MKKKLNIPILLFIICLLSFNILSCSNQKDSETNKNSFRFNDIFKPQIQKNNFSKPKDITYTLYLDDIKFDFRDAEELNNKLTPFFDSKNLSKTITLNYENKKDTYSFEEVGATYITSKIANKIYNDIKDTTTITLSSKELIPEINDEKLNQFIKNYSKSINAEPVDCTFNFKESNLSIKTHSKDGLSVSFDSLKGDLLNIINKKTTSNETSVKVSKIKPNLSDDLINKMTLYSKSSTKLLDKSNERLNNINLFCNSLSGTVINPNEIFSINSKTGERNSKNGYKKAKGYIDGKLVEFDGAGICQVVSTLYNSVLYTDLAVIERAPHEGPVPYIGIGLDATIYYGSIDFKFKNTLKSPVILQFISDGNNVTTKIFASDFNPNRKFKIEVKKADEFNSKTYKHIYENDNLIKSMLVSTDKYKEIKKE